MSQHNNAPFQPKSVLDLIRNYTASLLRNRTLNLNGVEARKGLGQNLIPHGERKD